MRIYNVIGYDKDGKEWYWGTPVTDIFDVKSTVGMALSHSEVKRVVIEINEGS